MPNIPAAPSIQVIFDEFKAKILDPTYYPKTPIETLKARMTAVSCLLSDDAALAKRAADFVTLTSTMKEDDLERLRAFATEITAWESFEICSVYTNDFGPFVEYKIGVSTTAGEKLIHRHALYKIDNEQCCYVSQTSPLIRVIGDPVLHQPGQLYPENPSAEEKTELLKQIEVAKAVLVETSGAGIAANQCATIQSPYQFAIVGVFKDNPMHVQGVQRRYPGVTYPAAMILVNPQIIDQSDTMQHFKHGCLSVPSPNRCEVKSHEEITIEYLDPTQQMARTQKTLKGIDAVVLWHELNHIIDGKTYIDTALASLNSSDLSKFEQLVEQELNRRHAACVIPELTVPPFYFTITMSQDGVVQLDETTLIEVLPKFTKETLSGFLKQCHALRMEIKAKAERQSFQALCKGSQFAGKAPSQEEDKKDNPNLSP